MHWLGLTAPRLCAMAAASIVGPGGRQSLLGNCSVSRGCSRALVRVTGGCLAPYNLFQSPTKRKESIWAASEEEERDLIFAFWRSLSFNQKQKFFTLERSYVIRNMCLHQRASCRCVMCRMKR